MKKEQHEVIIDGEIHKNNISKDVIGIFCKYLLRDILKRDQKP